MRNAIMEVNNNLLNGSSKASKDTIHPDVYQITHDLRAPLMSMQGLINLMKSDLTREHWDEYTKFTIEIPNFLSSSLSINCD